MDKSQQDEYHEQRFLENFIEFGALHRARVAYECLQRFKRVEQQSEATRASLALDILQTLLNTFEDVAIWLVIIPKWLDAHDVLRKLNDGWYTRPDWLDSKDEFDTFFRGQRPLPKWINCAKSFAELRNAEFTLAKLLQRTRSHERSEWDNMQRLAATRSFSPPGDLARTVHLPYRDFEFDELGIEQEHRESFRRLLKELSRLINIFTLNAEKVVPTDDVKGVVKFDLAAWRVLNPIKHGIRVTLSNSDQWGVGLCIHPNPQTIGDYWEFPVKHYYLVKLVVMTFVGCLALGWLLALAYQSRYRVMPSVSWLPASLRVNLERYDPYQIARVLRCSRVPRRYDLIPARSQQRHWIEPDLYGQLSRNWWRGHPE